MEFPKSMRIILLLVLLLCLIPVVQVFAQDEYIPPEPAIITLTDGTELEVIYWDHGSIDIASDTFSINIYLEQGSNASITIHNTGYRNDWGQGVIEIGNGWGNLPADEVVELGILPAEYREIWTMLQTVCGELNEIEEFWESLDEMDDTEKGSLKEDFELMRDGYFVPDTHVWLLFSNLYVGSWADDRTSRGYGLKGPIDFTLSTPSPWGDENPELFLKISANLPEDRWSIHIDPETEVCEISWELLEYIPGPEMEDWEPYIEKYRTGLEFFLDRVPSLIEGGVIEPDDEFGLLLEKALYGLNTFDFVLIFPDDKPVPSFFN